MKHFPPPPPYYSNPVPKPSALPSSSASAPAPAPALPPSSGSGLSAGLASRVPRGAVPVPVPVPDPTIKLRVGEEEYRVRASVLFSRGLEPQSVLAEVLKEHCDAGGELLDSGREVVIPNRDGRLFQFVLNFLRNAHCAVLPSDPDELRILLGEAQALRLLSLSALLWCLVRQIRLHVFSLLRKGAEVVFNPGALPLLWEGLAVMSQCHYTHSQNKYNVGGYVKGKSRRADSAWQSFDVFCPGCQQYDFSLVEGKAVRLEAGGEREYREELLRMEGRIVALLPPNGTCAQVDFPTPLTREYRGMQLHLPLRALLPKDYAAHITLSR